MFLYIKSNYKPTVVPTQCEIRLRCYQIPDKPFVECFALPAASSLSLPLGKHGEETVILRLVSLIHHRTSAFSEKCR